jgi:hypothetical protein
MAVTISGTVNPVAGSSAYGDGSALQFTAAGTAGQLLQSNGASAPTWASSVAATAGGTGQTSYAVGDLLYASTTTALSRLADIATGNALISGGVGVAPSWGKIALTTHVSGTLPVANGGTGTTSTTFVNLASNVTGTLPVANGGTGTTTPSLVAGTNITLSGTWPNQTINASGGGGSGTVTSIGLSLPSFLVYYGNNPITTSGTFDIFLSQTPSNGQLLIGNGTGFSYATLSAGANVTITNSSGSISIASSGGGGGGITWSANTSPGGSIDPITTPAGYNTSGNKLVVVIVGNMLQSFYCNVSSGASTFSQVFSPGSNTVVLATDTGFSLGSLINISFSSYFDFAMAYVYITSGNVTNSIGATSTSSPSTSATVTNPSPYQLNPRIIAVSTSSSLNLATAASTASGGGPTWASGSGFVHPTYSSLSACVWVGTGNWTGYGATPTLTSNPSSFSWYITGIASS